MACSVIQNKSNANARSVVASVVHHGANAKSAAASVIHNGAKANVKSAAASVIIDD